MSQATTDPPGKSHISKWKDVGSAVNKPQDNSVEAITRILAEPSGDGSLNQIRVELSGFLSWRRLGPNWICNKFLILKFFGFLFHTQLLRSWFKLFHPIISRVSKTRKLSRGCQSKENINFKRQRVYFPSPLSGLPEFWESSGRKAFCRIKLICF